MKKCVQTETPELLAPLNWSVNVARDGLKIKKIWGQRKVDEVGHSCPLEVLVQ